MKVGNLEHLLASGHFQIVEVMLKNFGHIEIDTFENFEYIKINYLEMKLKDWKPEKRIFDSVGLKIEYF